MQQQFAIKLVVHPQLYHYLEHIDKSYFFKLCEEINAHLEIETNDNMHINDYYFVSLINNKKIEV